MILWASLSVIAAAVLTLLAHRMEGGQTLGAKQAVYLAAFCALMLAGYNGYQWRSGLAAPEEIEAYVPLYPAARLRTRVPVEEMRVIHNLFATQEREETIRGQWIFETPDSTVEVGRFYERWASTAPHRTNIDIMMAYSELIVDAPNYSFTVLANNQWGTTRITYTLMGPMD